MLEKDGVTNGKEIIIETSLKSKERWTKVDLI